MSAQRFALFSALAFFVLFIAVNLTAHVWLRGARIDFTQGRLYSLSAGTRAILRPDQLAEPVRLTFYFSRDAAARDPQITAYAGRVRELLRSYSAASRGRVRVEEVNPRPFTEEEDAADLAGVRPLEAAGSDPLYFGLVGANSIDDRRTIPHLAPANEAFLEYQVTRLIYELEHPEPPVAALLTSLPIDPSAGEGGGPFSTFATELGRSLRIERVRPDFTALPANASVLIMVHPPVLTPEQTYAVDQFIMQRGRAFIALDPVALSAAAAASPLGGPGAEQTASSLPALLSAWGVSASNEVVLDGDAALPINTMTPQGQPVQAPQPLFFRVDPERLDRSDPITAPLARGLTFGAAGALSVSERPNVRATVLARTTQQSMRLSAEQALMQPSPFELMTIWAPTGRAESVAVRLSGALPSAFPGGAPEGVSAQGRLSASRTPAEVVIIADVDFLANDFYVAPQHGATFADNGAFALNAIESLAGSSDLSSLRARAPSLRRMEVVERMEREAQRAIEQRRTALEAELAQTEQRLRALQAQGASGGASGALDRAANSEVARFTRRLAEVRGELRAVARSLRADVDALRGVVMFVNIWMAPLAIAAAGVFLSWRRRRRVGGWR